MTLVVETGSGLSNANAYASVADVDSYASDLNRSEWVGDTVAKEAAIITATLYLDAKFVFIGVRATQTQALAWPRKGATDYYEGTLYSSSVVPLPVKRACMELAIKSLAGEVLLDNLARGGQIKAEKAGPIEVTYEDRASPFTFYMIIGLLKGLIRPEDSTYAPKIQGPSFASDQYFSSDQFNNNGNGSSPGGS